VNLRYLSRLLVLDRVIALCELSTGLVGLISKGTLCGGGGADR
jgi:hypothetical protein